MTITKELASLLAVALLFAPVMQAQQASPASAESTAEKVKLLERSPFLPPAPGYKGPMPSGGFRKEPDGLSPRFGFRQVADKHYWLTAVVLPSAASAFDAVSTFHAVSLGHPDANPLFGSHPTAGRVAGIKLGVGILQAMGIYRLKKYDMEADYEGEKHEEFPPRWWKMALFAPALFFAAGGYNYTLGRVKPPQ